MPTSGPASDRTTVLHIGWWRNGFHPYEPSAIGAADAHGSAIATGPNERRIRQFGGVLAATIALVWLIGASALCVFTNGSLILVWGLFVPPIWAAIVPVLVSAWVWQRIVRRTFSRSVPVGGDRGSADPRR